MRGRGSPHGFGATAGVIGALTVATLGVAALTAAPAGAAARAAAGTGARAVAHAPCTLNRIRACVQLSTQRAWLMRGGKVVYGPVRIASGRPGWRTSRGMFKVTFKDIDHRSHAFGGAPMPYSVFFHRGQAFHEGSLKIRSHGCVHLTHYSARRFYNYLHKGDPVRVR